MEFTNFEREFLEDLKRYPFQEEIKQLETVFSSAEIETYEHTMDNSSIDTSFGKVLMKLWQQGYTFLGTGRAPWLHNGRDVAVVFEDFRTFDKFWYHVSTWIVEDWKDEVDLYFGKKS